MKNIDYYREHLNSELAKRCERNRSYSLRSFARALGVDSGALSKILNGKQILSLRMAKKIVDKLELDPAQQALFLKSIANRRRDNGLIDVHPHIHTDESEYKGEDLDIEFYRIIADWYHFALMELTYVKDFSPEPRYIAQKLGISQIEAKLAIDRLIKLKLLEKKKGKLIKTKGKLSTTNRNVSTSALKKNQRQFLERAIESMENDPIEIRSQTSMTMAIDVTKIEIAKKMIREFQMKLSDYLETGSQSRVYNLSVALYPLQKEN